MTNPPEDSACRLCDGATTLAFNAVVLAKHDVSYHRCERCGSLQTQLPFWLPEAYGKAELSIDPGSARRVLDSFVLVDIVARLLGCRKLLDFGGNTGFLCRLLRDKGYDAYSFDRYVDSIYAPHFIGDPSSLYDLVSAFEVIEHFTSPSNDLEQLFGKRPRVVLATTELFSGQSSDWWYLAPREGQHVFFYSEPAARLVAARYGYDLLVGRTFLLFSRVPLSFLKRFLVRHFLRPRMLQVLGALLLMRRGTGAERDYALLSQRGAAD